MARGRKPLLDKPMNMADRAVKSSAERTARGMFRLGAWLDPEAHAALRFLLSREGAEPAPRGAIAQIVNSALIESARTAGLTDAARQRAALTLTAPKED